MSASNELVQVLFDCAAVHAADRKASFAWLQEMAEKFAAGFDRAVEAGEIGAGASAVVLYCHEFGRVFGPGMTATPGQIVTSVRKRLDHAAYERGNLVGVPALHGRENAAEATPGPSDAVISQAVEDRSRREAAEAAEKAEREASDAALLNPLRPEDLPIAALNASARAKGALRGLGLETYGDVKLYSQAKSLSEINGISEEAAESILKQIENAIAKSV